MPILKEKIKNDKLERQDIDRKVANAAMNPTESEAQEVRKIIAAISDDFKTELSESGFTRAITERIKKSIALRCGELDVDYETKKRIEILSIANITGLGPIQPYMDDESVTEVIVQRYDNICIERKGLIEKADASFMNEEHLRTTINRIVQPIGRQINLQSPMVDARLEDGSRVNATIPPATPDGATLTIRKFSKKALTGEDYLKFGSLDERMLVFLARCVQCKTSIIVSGGTTAGKTTLLNMLSGYIPKDELIVTIEDDCELQLNQPNVRRMEACATLDNGSAKITVQSLVKNALRMRPDRIIVGEIRDKTIVDMMSAMSTGHEGSMCTVHASSPSSLVNVRMPILYKMAGDDFSESAQAMQISEAIKLIVQLNRTKEGKRVITHITHVKGLDDNGRVELHDIYCYDEKKKRFYATGYIPKDILQQLDKNNIRFKSEMFQEVGGIHE